MKLTVAAVGRIRDGWLAEGVAEYAKRLSRFCAVQVAEVDDAPETLPIERGKAEEGRRLLAKAKPGAFVVALDPGGTPCGSVAFAAKLRGWLERGGAEVVFFVGGSNGLSDEALARADERLSLSEMTMTHAMARLVLLEQCYRAFKITAGERYHK